MQTEWAHRHPRLAVWVRPGLMCITMYYETIDPLAKGPIAEWFRGERMPQPSLRIRRGECLRSNNAFAVDVSGRSHCPATVIHLVRRPHPELAHGFVAAKGIAQVVRRFAVV